MIALLCVMIGILVFLAIFLLGYRAGWLDQRDRQANEEAARRYIVGGRMLNELPEWARRKTTEVMP